MTEPIVPEPISPEPIAPEPTPEPEESGAFFSGVSGEWQNDPTIQNFKSADMDTIAKTLVNQQGMIGKQGVILPNMGDAADVTRFYTELGMPATEEGYAESLKGNEWAQSQGYDPNEMAGIALEGGLTPDQASRTEQAYLRRQQEASERMDREAEDLRGQNEQQLRRTMGDKYDENMRQKDGLIDKFARTPEVAEELKAIADREPLIAATLSDIAGKFSEHSLGELIPQDNSMNPKEAQAAADEIRGDMSGPFWVDTDRAKHRKAVDEVTRLEMIAMRG